MRFAGFAASNALGKTTAGFLSVFRPRKRWIVVLRNPRWPDWGVQTHYFWTYRQALRDAEQRVNIRDIHIIDGKFGKIVWSEFANREIA